MWFCVLFCNLGVWKSNPGIGICWAIVPTLASQSLLSVHVGPVCGFGLAQRKAKRRFGRSVLQGVDRGPILAPISLDKPITET